MLTNATVSVPASFAGVVVVTASINGVETEVDYTENGQTVLSLSGKTWKVRPFLRDPRIAVLNTIESEPGEPEGFGLASDLVNGRNVYADLVGKPVYRV